MVGAWTFHPCCWSIWEKWAAVLASCVPLATTTLTLAWGMVDVVVDECEWADVVDVAALEEALDLK